MGTFEITSPEGKRYRVTAPDGASKQDVLDRVRSHEAVNDIQAASKPSKTSPPETMRDASNQAMAPVIESISKAAQSAPESAVKTAESIYQLVRHPIDTATGVAKIGKGVLQKLGIMSGDDATANAEAAGAHLVERYGSGAAIKKTFETDPVGMAADLSAVLGLGGGALQVAGATTRATAGAGAVSGALTGAGKAVGQVSRAVDPINAALQGGKVIAKGAAQGAATVIGELGTQTGAESLRLAARAGSEGGQAAKSFQENLRGVAPAEEAVNEARGAVEKLRRERGNQYRDQMDKHIRPDQTILSWNEVDTALNDMNKVATYKGQVLSPSTQAVRRQITDEVSKWKNLKASEFWTPEGFDALKRKIGDIRESTERGTPSRLVADQAYNAIKKTIGNQAPEYAKVMKGYEEASKQLREIESTLSLKPTASIDTALRKLQSVLRDNVNTNYGQRRNLAEFLVSSGAPNLMYKLAGQQLKSPFARGIGKIIAAETATVGAAAVGAGTMGAGAAALGALPFMSPRFMGEAAYYGGKATKQLSKLPGRFLGQSAFQAGRLNPQAPR